MFILIRTGSWSTSLMDGSPALLIRSMAILLRLTNSSSRRSIWPGKNTFTKVHGIFILFRQTLVTAVAFTFAVTRGQVRAENSFSTVVIDPGHGGSDPGGIPLQIVPEKTVALETALRLQKLLQRAGLRTVITRSTDIFVPLSVRSAIADAERNAIFVSIHYNASPRSSAHGIETYSENNRGAVLAARIQQEIIDRVSTQNRGIRSAEYYVLRKCRLPAVLVECGFLTNPTEAQLALTTAYREQIAEQISAGIMEQRQFAFPPLAPTHRSGRLVHKNKKQRKIVDLERFGYPLPDNPHRPDLDQHGEGASCLSVRQGRL